MVEVYVSMICSPEVYSLLRGEVDGMVAEMKRLADTGVRGLVFDASDNDLESCPLDGGRASPFLYTRLERLKEYAGSALVNVHLLVSGMSPMAARTWVRRGAQEVTFPINAFRKRLPALESMLSLFRRTGHTSSPPPANPLENGVFAASPLSSGISLPVGVDARHLNYRICELSDYILVRCQPGLIDREPVPGELEGSLDRVAGIRCFLEDNGLKARLLVYGGVYPENAREFLRAGADGLVVGTALFRSKDYSGFLRGLDA